MCIGVFAEQAVPATGSPRLEITVKFTDNQVGVGVVVLQGEVRRGQHVKAKSKGVAT